MGVVKPETKSVFINVKNPVYCHCIYNRSIPIAVPRFFVLFFVLNFHILTDTVQAR